VQGRPGDSGDLLLFDAALGALALGVKYHKDGGAYERPPSIQALSFFANWLRSFGLVHGRVHPADAIVKNVIQSFYHNRADFYCKKIVQYLLKRVVQPL
jgi:hypothetical protein